MAWGETLRQTDCQALAALPWIVTAPRTSDHEMREERFRPHGLTLNASVDANNDLLLRTFVPDGVGVGLVRADHAALGKRNRTYMTCPLGKGHTKLLLIYPQGAPGPSSDPGGGRGGAEQLAGAPGRTYPFGGELAKMLTS